MNTINPTHFSREEALQKINRSVVTIDSIQAIPPFTTGIIAAAKETEPGNFTLCVDWEAPNQPSTVTKSESSRLIELEVRLTFAETLQAMYISLDLQYAFSQSELQKMRAALANGAAASQLEQQFPKFITTNEEAATKLLPLACKLATELSEDTELRWVLIEANRLAERLTVRELEELEAENAQAINNVQNVGLKPNAPLRITRQALSFVLHPQGSC